MLTEILYLALAFCGLLMFEIMQPRSFQWMKLKENNWMKATFLQVLEEMLFHLGLVWFGPDLKLESCTHPLSRLILYQCCLTQSLTRTSPYELRAQGCWTAVLLQEATSHSLCYPFPVFVGCADESVAPWDDSITLGAVISHCVAHLCFEHSFHAHALEWESCRADSQAESELWLWGLEEICNIVFAVFCTLLFPDIMPSLLLARSLCSPLPSRRGNLTCKPFCSILLFHIGLVC